ncbi:MAG TPA: NADP-dependent oxidoreductase, partial [Agromyces sp.]
MAAHWIAPRPGTPEVWEFVEHEVPAPGSGEVTIAVRAAGMNPADVKHVASERPGATFPVPIGYEVSGVLTAIGPDTVIGSGAARIGDEVVAFRVQGGYATALTVDASTVFAKPARLSHAEAANLLLAGTTAAEMLDVVSAGAGETVLVHGASGAVGVSVLQQARLLGVRVVGTAGEHGAERVRRYGGIPVRYGDGLAARVREAAPSPVAAALDCVGTAEAVDVSLDLVATRSRIVTIVAAARAAESGFRAIAGALPASARFRDAARARLLDLAASGSLEVPLATTYPLADAKEAAAHLMAGHPGGKIALIP